MLLGAMGLQAARKYVGEIDPRKVVPTVMNSSHCTVSVCLMP